METFRMDGDDNRLYFRNPDHAVSDDEEFNMIMSLLRGADCEIGDTDMGPDCDLIHCECDTGEFSVVRSLDGDGTFLYSDDPEVIDSLEELFEEEDV